LKIGVIDYGAGNQKNIFRAIKALGEKPLLIQKYNDLKNTDHIIIPGMGSYSSAIKHLKKSGLFDGLKEAKLKEKKIFGICLGLQILFESGEEGGEIKGLNFFRGKVSNMKKNKEFSPLSKFPVLGWYKQNWNLSKFDRSFAESIKNYPESPLYLAHSFEVLPKSKDIIVAEYNYFGKNIVSAIKKDNLSGTQFHPEKSGNFGLKILKGFLL
tara:strand:- start:26 stop:661 length:636 start_codon:yes stop_codon:yes gene_type:complete